MNITTHTVATSSTTTDIAYWVCIISFFIAGGVAIYLLWEKTQEHKAAAKRPRVIKPTAKKAAKKSVTKKAPAKKAAKKPIKKK